MCPYWCWEGMDIQKRDAKFYSAQQPVVQKVENSIHQINFYPQENAIDFPNTYQLDNDLSGGQRDPKFKQSGPVAFKTTVMAHKITVHEIEKDGSFQAW